MDIVHMIWKKDEPQQDNIDPTGSLCKHHATGAELLPTPEHSQYNPSHSVTEMLNVVCLDRKEIV